MNVPVILQRGVPGSAVSVRQWIHILRQLGRLLEEFLDFYVNRYTRLLRSILVLLFPLNEVATLVVDPGSGLFSTGSAGENAPRAVFRTFAFTQNGEVCTVLASADYFSLEIWTLFLRAPCFAVFSAVRSLRWWIFWEPSMTSCRGLGGGGRRESHSQVTRHMQN